MESTIVRETSVRQRHDWLRRISVAFIPGPNNDSLNGIMDPQLAKLETLGHTVLDQLHGQIDLLLTSARFGKPVSWRQELMFSARRRFGLERAPTVVTLSKRIKGRYIRPWSA